MASPVVGDKDYQDTSRILNLPAPASDKEPARRVDLPVVISSRYKWGDHAVGGDAAAGYLKPNDITISVTQLDFNVETLEGKNWLPFLLSPASRTSTDKMLIQVTKVQDTTTYAVFRGTNLAIQTADNVLWDVVLDSYSGTILPEDEVDVSITLVGDKGGTGLTGDTGLSAGMQYTRTTNGVDPPTNGTLSVNNDTVSAVTVILIRKRAMGGVDVSPWLADASIGDQILFHAMNAGFGLASNFVIDSKTEHLNHWEIGVTSGLGLMPGLSMEFGVMIVKKGDTGADSTVPGPKGDTGDYGFRYKWDSDITSAEPATGFMKGNHADPNSITALKINTTSLDPLDLYLYWVLPATRTSLNKMVILISKKSDPLGCNGTFVATSIASNASTSITWNVTPLGGTGTFADDDELVVTVTLTGDKGDKGADGDQTGDLKYAMRTSEPTGWIFATGTIGSASSGASNRANEDTAALYKLLFEDFDDNTAPLVGGFGPSFNRFGFDNDWEFAFISGYPIMIPDSRGRILVTQDNMGGTAAGRVTVAGSGVNGTVVGATGGEETHLLTANESGLRNHSHVYYDSYNAIVTRQGGSNVNAANAVTGTNRTTNGSGAFEADEAHNNMPPALVLPLFIKL